MTFFLFLDSIAARLFCSNLLALAAEMSLPSVDPRLLFGTSPNAPAELVAAPVAVACMTAVLLIGLSPLMVDSPMAAAAATKLFIALL